MDLSVGGAELGGQVLAAGLVDEIQLFLGPVIVGGGKRALPAGMQAPAPADRRARVRGRRRVRPLRGGRLTSVGRQRRRKSELREHVPAAEPCDRGDDLGLLHVAVTCPESLQSG